jgi:NAD(P)-dependent dehydrogenase (short-subunit alcohol dehydrogenase family)
MITGRDQSGVDAAVRSLAGEAGDADRIAGVVADVRDRAAVERAVAETVKRFGALDTLVNNAGIGVFKEVTAMSDDEWDRVIGTNLTGVFYCCRAAVPEMTRAGGGWIINIASLAARNYFATAGAYCASKAGLLALSESLMLEVREAASASRSSCPGR